MNTQKNNSSRRKLEKQLNAALNDALMLSARFDKLMPVSRLSTKPKAKPQRKQQSAEVRTTAVPFEKAYTLQQQTVNKVNREVACERIGQIVVGPNVAAGVVYAFELDPTQMFGSRLQRIASNYEKFRFRRATLKVFPNLGTSVIGQNVYGYSENPEYQVNSAGGQAITQVFALRGSTSVPLFTQAVTQAVIGDKAKWYNVDPDTREKMSSVQGVFYVVVETPAQSLTAAAPISVFLDYDVEFKGTNTLGLGAPSVQVFPASALTTTDPSSGLYTVTPNSGEPAFPSMTLFQYYRLEPKWLPDQSGSSGVVTDPVSVDGIVRTATGVIQLYLSYDDYKTSTFLTLGDTLAVPRTTIALN